VVKSHSWSYGQTWKRLCRQGNGDAGRQSGQYSVMTNEALWYMTSDSVRFAHMVVYEMYGLVSPRQIYKSLLFDFSGRIVRFI
jgi:hypothetical protein